MKILSNFQTRISLPWRKAAGTLAVFSGLLAVPSQSAAQAAVPPSNSTAPIPTTLAHSSVSALHNVAILPFTGEDVGSGKLNAVTKRFQSELENTGSFKIVKRRTLNKALQARGREAGPCQTTECYQELAGTLGVEGIFTGVVSRGSETWRLQVRLLDATNGETTFGHLVEVFGGSDGSLSDNCKEMAQIASGLKTPESNYTVIDRTGKTVWPWVAGGLVVAGGATAAMLLLNQDPGSPTPPPTSSQNPDQLIVTW